MSSRNFMKIQIQSQCAAVLLLSNSTSSCHPSLLFWDEGERLTFVQVQVSGNMFKLLRRFSLPCRIHVAHSHFSSSRITQRPPADTDTHQLFITQNYTYFNTPTFQSPLFIRGILLTLL